MVPGPTVPSVQARIPFWALKKVLPACHLTINYQSPLVIWSDPLVSTPYDKTLSQTNPAFVGKPVFKWSKVCTRLMVRYWMYFSPVHYITLNLYLHLHFTFLWSDTLHLHFGLYCIQCTLAVGLLSLQNSRFFLLQRKSPGFFVNSVQMVHTIFWKMPSGGKFLN